MHMINPTANRLGLINKLSCLLNSGVKCESRYNLQSSRTKLNLFIISDKNTSV